MAKVIEKGRQKIETKLIECAKARVFTFSKRKKILFKDAKKLLTWTRPDVGVMMLTSSGQ